MSYFVAILVVVTAWLLMNVLTYSTFAADKRFAERGQWRVSETWLLTLALFGGSLGAKFAQKRKRHKTRKQPFATLLNLIVVGHILLIAAITLLGKWTPFFDMTGALLETLFVSGNAERGSAPQRFGPGS